MGFIITGFIAGFITLLAIAFYQRIADQVAVAKFKRQNGCLEPKKYSHADPVLGLDLFFIMGKAMKSGTMIDTSKLTEGPSRSSLWVRQL